MYAVGYNKQVNCKCKRKKTNLRQKISAGVKKQVGSLCAVSRTSRGQGGKKSNLNYTRDITSNRVTSGGAHLRCSAPGQHNSKETSQRWRAVGDALSDLIGLGIKQ